jgi:hypothetical protein
MMTLVSSTTETSPQSAPVIGIVAGGALLAAFLVGGPALIFHYTTPPAPVAILSPTTKPVEATQVTEPKVVAVAPVAVVPTPPPAVGPATAPAVVPVTPTDERLRRGWQLLSLWKYADAKAVFEPMAAGARPSPQALHGLALCLWKMDRDKRPAVSAIDQAASLAPGDASIIYNAAAMNLPDAPQQSAKLLREYMSDASRPLNEQMQNLLGLAISRMDVTKRVSVQAFYADYDKRLEAGKPQRRWGSQWLDADEVDAKWSRLNDTLSAASTAAKAHRETVDAANREGFRVIDMMSSGTDAEIAQAKAAMQEARKIESAAQEKLKQAQDSLTAAQPPFPQKAEPVIPQP